jgi:chorismate dehydratase
LSQENVKSYLTENIHYFLDPACVQGMELFFKYAQECGALLSAPPLFFLDAAKAAVI